MDEFEKIYISYNKKVFYYLKNLCNNDKLAEDLTQEVFYKTLVYLSTSANINVGLSWLIKVAHNLFIDYIRKNKINIITLDNLVNVLEASSIDIDFKMDFEILLKSIPTKYRVLLLLNNYFSFTYAEMSSIMNCSESAIKASLFRARKKFKEVFKNYEERTIK